ncbi:hypothetical protein ACFIQG_22055 [Comamonas odontotermitis]|uniref:hypothetical protein n=1 Tax=Comamonas odontotermitis TaxID=379895 RepID=UPI00366D4CBE
MNDLSNHYALSRAQARWDGMEPDYDEPASMASLLELEKENFDLRDKLAKLLEEARDSGEKLNRISCCTGDRLLRLCNKIEGIEDDE